MSAIEAQLIGSAIGMGIGCTLVIEWNRRKNREVHHEVGRSRAELEASMRACIQIMNQAASELNAIRAERMKEQAK